MYISDNLRHIKESLPNGVRLVAVSKYHPNADLQEAYNAEQRIFGESHVQELVEKEKSLPKDIEWHFIGHLQSNKVKYIAPFISLIHAVDTMKLLKEIDKQAAKNGRIINCLLQVHIAQEETKFGFTPKELVKELTDDGWKGLDNVRICGLMCMATNTDDENQIRREFHSVHTLFQEIKDAFFVDKSYFTELSMGMSDDYPIAIEEGSTMIRVGSKIFGERDYSKKTT